MARWDAAAVEQLFEQLSPSGDPADPKERKRRKLLEVATELFTRQGYRKTSIDEVAAHAGVAKGTVYLYFKTKGELLLHCIVAEKKRYMERFLPVLDDRIEPRRRLKMYLQAVLVVAREMPLVSRLMSGDLELLAALDDMPQQAMAESLAIGLDLVSQLIDQAAAPHRHTEQELKDRAQTLIGLAYLGGFIANEKIRRGLSVERFAAILADMIVDGIGPVGEER